MKVLLCSTSDIKTNATNKFLQTIIDQDTNNYILETFNCDALGLPPQPIDCTKYCAKERLDYAKNNKNGYDLIISIESGIEKEWSETMLIRERCVAMIKYNGLIVSRSSYLPIGDEFKSTYFSNLTQKFNNKNIQGYSETFGQQLVKNNIISGLDSKNHINDKNWMKELFNVDREDMILEALKKTWSKIQSLQMDVKTVINAYKEYPDFPKPGVLFQDIFSVLSSPYMTKIIEKLLKRNYKWDNIDYVVGLESRGFFGILLARVLDIGFIPVRKAGKLPGVVETIEYGTEYSRDKMEIQTNIREGSRVVIFDDLIATGGSLRACIDLLERLKCTVVDCCVLREVKELREKAKETLQRSYTVLLMC